MGTPAGGRRNSGSNSGLSASSLSPVTKNKPLKVDKVRWKSDIALTEGQLMSKRDEFWDTAPAFEGKTEIWVALKAAVDATFKDDVPLAQAILDGAGISLPSGSNNTPAPLLLSVLQGAWGSAMTSGAPGTPSLSTASPTLSTSSRRQTLTGTVRQSSASQY